MMMTTTNKRQQRRHSPPVLVPGLDLGVGEGELGCQLHAVLHAEVFLSLERLLQTRQLVVREGRASLARLLRLHQQTATTRLAVRQTLPGVLRPGHCRTQAHDNQSINQRFILCLFTSR